MELPDHITLQYLAQKPAKIALTISARMRMTENRTYLEQLLENGGTFYGINTGFGSLCNVKIAGNELAKLQENLVCSHACGMGDEVSAEIVALMLLLKVHGIGLGYSGVRPVVSDMLVGMYNAGIRPIIYELGSLGASGDLAPLAHMSLPLIGRGSVRTNGVKQTALAALETAGLHPLGLAAKEGLALLNGTQFMTAHLAWCMIAATRLAKWADLIGAMSAEAFLVKDEPFRAPIHALRPHKGQVETARQILQYLSNSELQKMERTQVQDPYSFRCMPQVHGATKDVMRTVEQVLEIEMNSVTDNPIVLHDEDAIVSGGNFHGQTLALHADFLAIALAELGNISERRTYLLISGQRGLPPFLAPDAGLNSGFMIAQYAAAAIVSQNKQYCTPASVDSIVSSNGQEDHVSMGANAVTKLLKVVKNLQRILAIELVTAAQALDMRLPVRSSPVIEQVRVELREVVTFMDRDDELYGKFAAAGQFLDRNAETFE